MKWHKETSIYEYLQKFIHYRGTNVPDTYKTESSSLILLYSNSRVSYKNRKLFTALNSSGQEVSNDKNIFCGGMDCTLTFVYDRDDMILFLLLKQKS